MMNRPTVSVHALPVRDGRSVKGVEEVEGVEGVERVELFRHLIFSIQPILSTHFFMKLGCGQYPHRNKEI